MSTYVREKVLRIPTEKTHIQFPNDCFSRAGYMKRKYHGLFDYATPGMFQFSPTVEDYIDYVIEYEWDADGEYGRTIALTEREKDKYRTVFQKIDPLIDMNDVRLVEFCWYNCTKAPDYYDDTNDPFYDEV